MADDEALQRVAAGMEALSQQNQQIAQRLEAQERFLAEQARGKQTPATPGEVEKLRDQFIEEFGRDPIGTFRQTIERAAQEGEQRAVAKISTQMQRDQATAYARYVMQQNPDLRGYDFKVAEVFENINQNPQTRNLPYEQKVSMALDSTRQWKTQALQYENQIRERQQQQRSNMAFPQAGAFQLPDGTTMTERESSEARFHVLKDWNARARGSLRKQGAA